MEVKVVIQVDTACMPSIICRYDIHLACLEKNHGDRSRH